MRLDQQPKGLGASSYRERTLLCAELADMSRSVPLIRSRLEALARTYRQRVIDLERGSDAYSPERDARTLRLAG
jgi:hypothetical protein